MLIAFVHNGKTFLPALEAYIEFFSKYNIDLVDCTLKELPGLHAQVEWHFMGVDTRKKIKTIKVHDYLSASTPPLAGFKNTLKLRFNAKPDFRLFLNKYVHSCFPFDDNVPFGYRDMGVRTNFPRHYTEGSVKFDFIYVGEMRTRQLQQLIKCFTTRLRDRTILFLSKDYADLQQRLKDYSNIHFSGPVPLSEVAKYIFASKFAINYIPDREPFNQQTSTKFLEYAACGIPIVTTRYEWILRFQEEYGGTYFYLNDDLSNFSWEAVNAFGYSFPDLTTWSWESQIRNSGVLNFLSSKFPDIRW
jgi:glycosyltransferase involved in cell wall biosynthesis